MGRSWPSGCMSMKNRSKTTDSSKCWPSNIPRAVPHLEWVCFIDHSGPDCPQSCTHMPIMMVYLRSHMHKLNKSSEGTLHPCHQLKVLSWVITAAAPCPCSNKPLSRSPTVRCPTARTLCDFPSRAARQELQGGSHLSAPTIPFRASINTAWPMLELLSSSLGHMLLNTVTVAGSHHEQGGTGEPCQLCHNRAVHGSARYPG